MTKTLLIVDDPLLRGALADSVNRREGFSMTAAAGADEAIRMGADKWPDILIASIAEMTQAECLREIDRLGGHFQGCKLILLDSKKRAFTRRFQNELLRRHIMAYTYSNRDIDGFIALLESVSDNYTTFPEAADD